MARIFVIVVVAVMGISAGASLAEAAVMVPFWKEMGSGEFYDWYSANHVRLVDFYSPLQILSAVGAVLAYIWLLLKRESGKWPMLFALLSNLAVLVLFFVYFKDSNAAFTERTIPADQLPTALAEWGRWQWARVSIATLAFVAALFAIPNVKVQADR
jgi:hypothetical protein